MHGGRSCGSDSGALISDWGFENGRSDGHQLKNPEKPSLVPFLDIDYGVIISYNYNGLLSAISFLLPIFDICI